MDVQTFHKLFVPAINSLKEITRLKQDIYLLEERLPNYIEDVRQPSENSGASNKLFECRNDLFYKKKELEQYQSHYKELQEPIFELLTGLENISITIDISNNGYRERDEYTITKRLVNDNPKLLVTGNGIDV